MCVCLCVNDKQELAEATAKLADVESGGKKSDEALKGAKERMQSLEVEIAQLRQRLNVANTAATRAQEVGFFCHLSSWKSCSINSY